MQSFVRLLCATLLLSSSYALADTSASTTTILPEGPAGSTEELATDDQGKAPDNEDDILIVADNYTADHTNA